MFTKIISLYETRKRKLNSVLNRSDLKPENKHQVYGAINELELFLKTLREEQNKYMELVQSKKIPDIKTGELEHEDLISRNELKKGIFSIFFKR